LLSGNELFGLAKHSLIADQAAFDFRNSLIDVRKLFLLGF
jgi:hypothetical protein